MARIVKALVLAVRNLTQFIPEIPRIQSHLNVRRAVGEVINLVDTRLSDRSINRARRSLLPVISHCSGPLMRCETVPPVSPRSAGRTREGGVVS